MVEKFAKMIVMNAFEIQKYRFKFVIRYLFCVDKKGLYALIDSNPKIKSHRSFHENKEEKTR